MFDQIRQIIYDQAAGVLSSKDTMPTNTQRLIARETADSILETIQRTVAQGQFTDLTDFLSGKQSSEESMLTRTSSEALDRRLEQHLSLSYDQAHEISIEVVPAVLGKIVQRFNDPTGQQFDLKGMIGQFAGAKFGSIDISTLLSSLGGKPKD